MDGQLEGQTTRVLYNGSGIHGPKPVCPGLSGSVLVLTGPYWKNFGNLGTVRTRTEKIFKAWDWTEPGPSKSWTDSDRSVPGPGRPCIPATDVTSHRHNSF